MGTDTAVVAMHSVLLAFHACHKAFVQCLDTLTAVLPIIQCRVRAADARCCVSFDGSTACSLRGSLVGCNETCVKFMVKWTAHTMFTGSADVCMPKTVTLGAHTVHAAVLAVCAAGVPVTCGCKECSGTGGCVTH
jgi:hypothetical protein